MKHPLAGISLILLVLFSLADPWVPVLGSGLTPIALWAGLACGVAGLVSTLRSRPEVRVPPPLSGRLPRWKPSGFFQLMRKISFFSLEMILFSSREM